MNLSQILAEVGRLHMENIALRAENEQLMSALSVMAGPAPAELTPAGESESESAPETLEGPSDGQPEQGG